MSKKFYVLYTIKQYVIPRIFKSKATINKYLEENQNMEFKQFSNE